MTKSHLRLIAPTEILRTVRRRPTRQPNAELRIREHLTLDEVGTLIQAAKGNRVEMIRSVYLLLLSRYPTAAETTAAENYFKNSGVSAKQADDDLAWALINSKEFLYRH